jgi:ferredoxin-thioredoxin reductase catalytic subunit
MSREPITKDEIDRRYEELFREAEEGGYHLNPDVEFTKNLVRGLLFSTAQYMPGVSCRLANGRSRRTPTSSVPAITGPDLQDYEACCVRSMYQMRC